MPQKTVTVRLARVSTRPEDAEVVVCSQCGESLELHQPDAGFPDRMLGTCDVCRTWFLMDLIPGEPAAVMVVLPDANFFLDAMGEGGEGPPLTGPPPARA